MDKTFDFYPVSIDEAKQALEDFEHLGLIKKPVAKHIVRGQSRNEKVGLHPATAQWLNGFPSRVVPANCAEHYPRIVNRIHQLWTSPAHLKMYLQDLVLDKRGGRQGFPHGIAEELEVFRQYCEVLYPSQDTCLWAKNTALRR